MLGKIPDRAGRRHYSCAGHAGQCHHLRGWPVSDPAGNHDTEIKVNGKGNLYENRHCSCAEAVGRDAESDFPRQIADIPNRRTSYAVAERFRSERTKGEVCV